MSYRSSGRGMGQAASASLDVSASLRVGSKGSAAALPSGLTKISPESLSLLPRMAQEVRGAVATQPFNIIPPECAKMVAPKGASGEQPANTPLVVALPFVKLSDSQVSALLTHFYGDGGGGDVLLEVIGQSRTSGSIREFPSLVASGWMRDSVSNQDKTRGVLWFAFAFPTAINTLVVTRLVQAFMRTAWTRIGAAGTVPLGGAPVAADGTSDQALQGAAMASALTLVAFIEVLATLFGARVGITRDAKRLATQFEGQAKLAEKAVMQLSAAPVAVQRVDEIVTAALGLPPDQAQTAYQLVREAKSLLLQMKSDIIAGVNAVPAIEQEIAANNDPNGALANRIRQEILSDVQAEIAKIDIEVGREYRRCMYYSLAQKSLDRSLRDIATAFEKGAAAVAVLRNGSDAVAQVLAAIDLAVAKLDEAERQIPLSWAERDFAGVPVYVWLGGGAVAFLGGVAVLRVMKKRRQQAAKGAAKPVTPNRRRRRRSGSR